MNLESFSKWSYNAVYGLINHETNSIDLWYTSNLLKSVASLIDDYNKGVISPHRLQTDFYQNELIILEKDIPEEQLKLRHGYWLDHYSKLGYNISRKKPGKIYTVTTTIERFDYPNLYGFYFVVSLKAASKVVVGVFDNKEDLEKFIEAHYQSENAYDIIYACNNLTKRFYEYNNLFIKKEEIPFL